MKKLLLPLAILAASPVQAQSAIFGVADVNLQPTKGTTSADNHTDFDTVGNSGVPDASILTRALAIGLVAGSGVKTDIRASNSIGCHLPSGLGGFYGNAHLGGT